MASIREQVLQAVKALLSGEETPAATVSRSRLDQVEPVDLPCYDIEPGPEKDGAEFDDSDACTRVLEIKLRAVVDATDSDDGDLDPFYVFAWQRLMADHTLGGLAESVALTDAVAVFRPQGRDMIGLEMSFEVTFAVQRANPAQKG